MDFDLNYVPQFKAVIEDIIKAELKKYKITNFISAVVQNVNEDGTVDVYFPPNKKDIATGILNKSGEILEVGDSVEINTKNGNLSNSWVALKHGASKTPKINSSSSGSSRDVGGLPVNSVIGFDGTSSQIPHGYEIIENTPYIGESLKVGTILYYSGSDIPEGWKKCNGEAISREVYSELFEVIGTRYGSGDGVNTFNLPDFRERVAVGYAGDGVFDLGSNGGEKTHTLTVDEIPPHKHQIKTNNDDWNNTQSGGNYGTTKDGTTAWYNNNWYTENTGGGQAHNNMQPYLVVNFIIKVSSTTPVQSEVVNEYSTSTVNSYSANYINSLPGWATSDSLPIGSEVDFEGNASDIPTGWEIIENPDAYPLFEEVKTNKTWIDGKSVYRTVLSIGSMSANVEATRNISAISFDTIVSLTGFERSSQFPHIPIPFVNNNRNYAYVEGNTLVVNVGWAASEVYIIIEYTK